MELDVFLPAELGNRHELLERRQLAADLALGQFQQQARNVLAKLLYVLQSNKPVLVRQKNRFDPVQFFQAVFLMNLQMA
ncbi:hypothetical protein D3C74_399740 [compost metagenome]